LTSVDANENQSRGRIPQSVATDRIGYIIVGIKSLFDSKADANGQVQAEEAAGMLLDLCLDKEIFTKARSILKRDNINTLDFRAFLQLYIPYTGLSDIDPNKASMESNHNKIWIPRSDGTWTHVEDDVIEHLHRAAAPLSISNDSSAMYKSIFLLPNQKHRDDIAVKAEDLQGKLISI
jgi:hypothetical protein